jgi:hypothetical protein
MFPFNKLKNVRWGNVCSSCKAKYAKDYRLKNPHIVVATNRKYRKIYKELTNGYAVYYLPEEHYVGFTNCVKQRVIDHRKSGKIVDGIEVIATFERAVDAHWFETLLHQREYNGFQHKY